MDVCDMAGVDKNELVRDNRKEIMVSVWCTTYNHEKYLRDAIEGFLNQKVDFTYEIVIHDDASTDATPQILKEYENKYPDLIHVIYEKENQYSKPTRSKVFNEVREKHLTGKYVAFCEGDDYWTDVYKLAKQVDFLEKNPGYSATVHNIRCVNENGDFLHKDYGLYPISEAHIYGVEQVKKMQLAGQTASMVCRNIWKNLTEDETRFLLDDKINGDMKLNILLGLRGDIYYFKDIMADHRRCFSGDSWTAQTTKKNMLWYFYNSQKRMSRYIYDRLGVQVCGDAQLLQMLKESKKRLRKCFNKENFKIYMKFLCECFRVKPEKKSRKTVSELDMYRKFSQKHLDIVKMYDLWMMTKQEGHTIEEYLQKKHIKTIVIYGMGYLGNRLFHELKNSSIKVVYALDANSTMQLPDLQITKLGKERKQDVDAVIVTAFSAFEEIKPHLEENGYENIIGLDEILYDLLRTN